MITLTAGDSLYGSSQLGTATITVFGDEFTISGSTDSFKQLYQGQPPSSPTLLATVPADKQWLIRSIHVVNTDGSTQYFALFTNGTTDANRICPNATLSSLGFAVYSSDAWRFYDTSGQLLTVGNTGPIGPQGSTGPATFLDAEPGDEGPAGPPGQSGPTGATGGQGEAGPAVFLDAEPGEEGQPGPQGQKGDTGSQGNTGSQGETGPAVFLDAEQGEEGQMGPPGSKGDTGSQGATGPAVFLDAEPGDEGVQGPPGIKGDTGGQGETGPAVFLDAEQGEEGQIGPPGAAGSNGSTGGQGETGPAVFLDAEPGDEGPMGPPGAAGQNGTVSITVTEVDFGTFISAYHTATVVDGAVTPSTAIIITQSGAAATGRQADENEMDPLVISATPGSGQFTLNAAGKDGPFVGKYKFNYVVG